MRLLLILASIIAVAVVVVVFWILAADVTLAPESIHSPAPSPAAEEVRNPFEEVEAVNPFEEEATYTNPFADSESGYQNPFESL